MKKIATAIFLSIVMFFNATCLTYAYGGTETVSEYHEISITEIANVVAKSEEYLNSNENKERSDITIRSNVENALIDMAVVRQKMLDELSYLAAFSLFNEGKVSIINIIAFENGENLSYDIEYTVNYGEFSETIMFQEFSRSRVVFVIENEDVVNTIELSEDRVYINGKEVVNKVSIGPCNARYSDYEYTSDCPYGNPSDYTKYQGVTSVASIDVQNRLSETLYTAILVILSTLGPAGFYVTAFASFVYIWVKSNSPNSHYLSYKEYKYWHSSCGNWSGGYISAFGAYVTKSVTDWYSEENYGGGGASRSFTYTIRYLY